MTHQPLKIWKIGKTVFLRFHIVLDSINKYIIIHHFLVEMKHFLGWELHSSLFSSSLTREIHHFKLILLLERDFHGYFYVRLLCWGNDQRRDWDDVVFAYCYLKGELWLEVLVNPLRRLVLIILQLCF